MESRGLEQDLLPRVVLLWHTTRIKAGTPVIFRHSKSSQICKTWQDSNTLLVTNDANKKSNDMIIYLLWNQQDHKWGEILVFIFFQHRELSPFDSKVSVFRNDPCQTAVWSEGQKSARERARSIRPIAIAGVRTLALLCSCFQPLFLRQSFSPSYEEQGCDPETVQACVY